MGGEEDIEEMARDGVSAEQMRRLGSYTLRDIAFAYTLPQLVEAFPMSDFKAAGFKASDVVDFVSIEDLMQGFTVQDVIETGRYDDATIAFAGVQTNATVI